MPKKKAKKAPRRDMYAAIKFDLSGLDDVIAKLELAKAQLKANPITETPIQGGNWPAGRYKAGFSPSITGRRNDPGLQVYFTPLGESKNAMASSYLEPGGKLSGLSFVDEASDFYSMGYMNRATRSIMSQIPGVSPMLYALYRGRAALVEFGRGSGLGLYKTTPVASGQLWREGKLDKNIYEAFTGSEQFYPSGTGAMMNVHAAISALVVATAFLQFAKQISDQIEELNNDKEKRMKESMSEMSDREFLRYMRANKKKLGGYAVW